MFAHKAQQSMKKSNLYSRDSWSGNPVKSGPIPDIPKRTLKEVYKLLVAKEY